MPFVHTSKVVFLHNSLIWLGILTKSKFSRNSMFWLTRAVAIASDSRTWHVLDASTEADKYDSGLL